jgi:hypothetical protein
VDPGRFVLRNPYICGGWVASPDFYGRQKLVQEIVDGRFGALYIMGRRQSGKTSLLHRVEEVRVSQRRPCLFLDLQATGRTIDGLFRVLRAELRNKARYWMHLFSPDLLAASDLFGLVDELLGRVEVQGMELLLLLDEADVLLGMASSFPEPLARLWEMGREYAALQVVVAASRALLSMGPLLSSRVSNRLSNEFRLRHLTRLDDAGASALIQQRNSASPVWVAPHLMERIMEATGCQPHLLQLLCQRLYQSDHSLRPLTESDLEVDELLASLFSADYQSLHPEERELLWPIAERPGEDLSALEVTTGFDGRNLAISLYWLKCLGYIRRRKRRFFIANRFLASWLLSLREELTEAGSQNAEGRSVPASDSSRGGR